MDDRPHIIIGGSQTDDRGTLSFVNAFEMSDVKRFYMIENKDLSIIRGWRGHQFEQRWFFALNGELLIQLIKIDNFDTPSTVVEFEKYTLSMENNQILHVPAGYASTIQATRPGSKLLVFADSLITDAIKDDHQFPLDYFENKIK